MKYLRKFLNKELNSVYLCSKIIESKIRTVENCLEEINYLSQNKPAILENFSRIKLNSNNIIEKINELTKFIKYNEENQD